MSRRISFALALALALGAVACTNNEPVIEAGIGELHQACATGPTTRGIDVSAWQGAIDWNRVAASGVRFSFIRVSDGTHSIDSRFTHNWSAARDAGVLRGAYQFFRAGQDVSAQANIMINALRSDPGELAPVIDVEADSIQGRSASQVNAAVRQWIDMVGAATGTTPIIYTGAYVTGSSAASYAANPLWIAGYFSDYSDAHCPRITDNWTHWTFWQYSDRGHIPGISGNVDMDVFDGTLAELRAFAGGHAPPTPPPPTAMTGALAWPIEPHTVTSYVTHAQSGGSVRYDCQHLTRTNHKGTDFGVPRGTPVHAAAAGRVIRAVDGCVEGNTGCGGFFGNHVILLHSSGRATLYAHMTNGSIRVHTGDMVECGQELGLSGNTGHSTGPHMHFEVRDGVTGIGDYYSRSPTDPFGGMCSTQARDLWGNSCTPRMPHDDSRYVSATYPRAVTVRPGQTITQAWRLENTGTTTWTSGEMYELTHTGGPSLDGLAHIGVASDVRPSTQMRFEATFNAPMTSGDYVVEYRMTHAGTQFGASVELHIRVAGPANCHSHTLNMDVPSGSCVQVGYAGCGASSCGWYACSDGAWHCTDGSTCTGDIHPHDGCTQPPPPGAGCSALSCADCVATPDCAFCPGTQACVPAADAASCDGGTTMAPGACGACNDIGGTCIDRFECCGASSNSNIDCIDGFCEDVTMCAMQGDTCVPTDPMSRCCGVALCGLMPGGGGQCCQVPGGRCASSADCCGYEQCSGGICQPQQVGQQCLNTQECYGSSYCLDNHTCGY